MGGIRLGALAARGIGFSLAIAWAACAPTCP